MIFIFKIANILAGLLLGITTLDKLDGESNFFNDLAKKLIPYTTTIGGLSLGLGVFLLVFRDGCFLYDLLGIAAGLLLLTHVLSQIPTIGEFLVKLSKMLMPFKAIVGMAILVLTLLGFFGMNILC